MSAKNYVNEMKKQLGSFQKIFVKYEDCYGSFSFTCHFENHVMECSRCPYFTDFMKGNRSWAKCSYFDVETVYCEKCTTMPCALQYVYLIKEIRDFLPNAFKYICCNCFGK